MNEMDTVRDVPRLVSVRDLALGPGGGFTHGLFLLQLRTELKYNPDHITQAGA